MKDKLFKKIITIPVIVYALVLILLPLIYIFILSFLKSDSYGGVINVFNLGNYLKIFDIVYIKVFVQSFLIALVTTLICILIAYPFCLFISQKKKKTFGKSNIVNFSVFIRNDYFVGGIFLR